MCGKALATAGVQQSFINLFIIAGVLVTATAARLAAPKLVPVGPVELVWDQDVDACPGKNVHGHVGEQPDSMPLAWHNPLTNRTSLISANDWGTFAKVGPLFPTPCTPFAHKS